MYVPVCLCFRDSRLGLKNCIWEAHSLLWQGISGPGSWFQSWKRWDWICSRRRCLLCFAWLTGSLQGEMIHKTRLTWRQSQRELVKAKEILTWWGNCSGMLSRCCYPLSSAAVLWKTCDKNHCPSLHSTSHATKRECVCFIKSINANLFTSLWLWRSNSWLCWSRWWYWAVNDLKCWMHTSSR